MPDFTLLCPFNSLCVCGSGGAVSNISIWEVKVLMNEVGGDVQEYIHVLIDIFKPQNHWGRL